RPMAERVLLHDLPIQMRAEDSVVRSLAPLGEPATMVVRRSRGYVPRSLALPVATPVPILACGAAVESTFCLARGRRAWLGPHLGDLEHYDTLEAFEEGVRHFQALYGIRPQ